MERVDPSSYTPRTQVQHQEHQETTYPTTMEPPRPTGLAGMIGEYGEPQNFPVSTPIPYLPRPKFGCRKYHMESDIFGTGLSPSYSPEYIRPTGRMDPTVVGRELGAAGRPTTTISPGDWFRDDADGSGRKMGDEVEGYTSPRLLQRHLDSPRPEDIVFKNGNAREGGGNPITGQGYSKQPEYPHSQRRQFNKPPPAKLW